MKGGKTALYKTSLYETLKRKILTLELAPGGDLDEVALSGEYGISRTPVRDVLRQLSGEGFVDIRENRGARVIPLNHETLRDFFQVAPMIYEAVGRLAVQRFNARQLKQLKDCQFEFRSAVAKRRPEVMVVENNRFHAIIGEMAGSAFLQPSLNRLLIDHARIGHTFFRPSDDPSEMSLQKSCEHHEQIIEAITAGDESAMVRLTLDHWELSRGNMERFIVPSALESQAWKKSVAELPRDRAGRRVETKSATSRRSGKSVIRAR
jgi:DNA-binding GntR family transcriptional regulator